MPKKKSSLPYAVYFKKYPVLDLIGNTPLVELDLFKSLAPALKVFLKCEWMNPGGSLKDRPVREMLLAALQEKKLKPGKTILDSSSGNAGIAYALIGAVLGFPVEIVIPGNASRERLQRLAAHGAKITKTDPILGYDEALRTAHRLFEANPDKYFMPDQYRNAHNWRAHYTFTAQEILKQTKGRVTHFVCGVGTGGSITGIARRLKKFNKKIKIIRVVPERFPGIEGLKPLGEPEDIVPEIFDPSVVDREISVSIEEAADYCQKLAHRGLFVGQSSGAYLKAIEVLAGEKTRGLVVTLGCDTGERYFSTRLWDI